jgi:hypothetical protein
MTKEGLAGGATYLVANLRIVILRSLAGKFGGKISASFRLPDSVEDDKFKIQDLTPDFATVFIQTER